KLPGIAPAAQDRDVVGDRHDLAKLVGDEDERLSLVAEGPYDCEELVDLLSREDGCGLVEDQKLRSAVEHLQNFHALLNAERDVFGALVWLDDDAKALLEVVVAGFYCSTIQPQPPASGRSRVAIRFVGKAVGGRRSRAADEPGDGEDRQDVRKRRKELHRDLHAPDRGPLQRERERCPVTEEERCDERTGGRPAAEDHRREPDESASAGHAVGERVRDRKRKVRTAERGQEARSEHRPVARRPDGDPNRVRRTWMLADRAEAQPRN